MAQTTIIITETLAGKETDSVFLVAGNKDILTRMAANAKLGDDEDLARALLVIADRIIPQLNY